MRFLPEGLNPFKIQASFKSEFASEFYVLKSRETWKLDQKGNFGHLNLSISVPSLENFGKKGRSCFCIFQFEALESIWKSSWNLEELLKQVLGLAQFQLSRPAAYLAQPTSQIPSPACHHSTVPTLFSCADRTDGTPPLLLIVLTTDTVTTMLLQSPRCCSYPLGHGIDERRYFLTGEPHRRATIRVCCASGRSFPFAVREPSLSLGPFSDLASSAPTAQSCYHRQAASNLAHPHRHLLEDHPTSRLLSVSSTGSLRPSCGLPLASSSSPTVPPWVALYGELPSTTAPKTVSPHGRLPLRPAALTPPAANELIHHPPPPCAIGAKSGPL
jgi:hypothetical protein